MTLQKDKGHVPDITLFCSWHSNNIIMVDHTCRCRAEAASKSIKGCCRSPCFRRNIQLIQVVCWGKEYKMPSSLGICSTVLCALIVTCTSTAIAVGHKHHRRQAHLPCEHPLRIVVPSLFTHCPTSCGYSEWTAWEVVQRRIPTTINYCDSRLYYVQERTRKIVSVIGDRADCKEVNQTEKICTWVSVWHLCT